MNAEEARAITYAAEDVAHDEYESNMVEALNIIYAKIKEAAGKRKYEVTISYNKGPNPKRTEEHWIGPCMVLQYEGTWPDCWSVVSAAGKDLCQRLSAQNFSATINYSSLQISWKLLRPRNETDTKTE
jgi:hypothetical protein